MSHKGATNRGKTIVRATKYHESEWWGKDVIVSTRKEDEQLSLVCASEIAGYEFGTDIPEPQHSVVNHVALTLPGAATGEGILVNKHVKILLKAFHPKHFCLVVSVPDLERICFASISKPQSTNGRLPPARLLGTMKPNQIQLNETFLDVFVPSLSNPTQKSIVFSTTRMLLCEGAADPIKVLTNTPRVICNAAESITFLAVNCSLLNTLLQVVFVVHRKENGALFFTMYKIDITQPEPCKIILTQPLTVAEKPLSASIETSAKDCQLVYIYGQIKPLCFLLRIGEKVYSFNIEKTWEDLKCSDGKDLKCSDGKDLKCSDNFFEPRVRKLTDCGQEGIIVYSPGKLTVFDSILMCKRAIMEWGYADHSVACLKGNSIIWIRDHTDWSVICSRQLNSFTSLPSYLSRLPRLTFPLTLDFAPLPGPFLQFIEVYSDKYNALTGNQVLSVRHGSSIFLLDPDKKNISCQLNLNSPIQFFESNYAVCSDGKPFNLSAFYVITENGKLIAIHVTPGELKVIYENKLPYLSMENYLISRAVLTQKKHSTIITTVTRDNLLLIFEQFEPRNTGKTSSLPTHFLLKKKLHLNLKRYKLFPDIKPSIFFHSIGRITYLLFPIINDATLMVVVERNGMISYFENPGVKFATIDEDCRFLAQISVDSQLRIFTLSGNNQLQLLADTSISPIPFDGIKKIEFFNEYIMIVTNSSLYTVPIFNKDRTPRVIFNFNHRTILTYATTLATHDKIYKKMPTVAIKVAVLEDNNQITQFYFEMPDNKEDHPPAQAMVSNPATYLSITPVPLYQRWEEAVPEPAATSIPKGKTKTKGTAAHIASQVSQANASQPLLVVDFPESELTYTAPLQAKQLTIEQAIEHRMQRVLNLNGIATNHFIAWPDETVFPENFKPAFLDRLVEARVIPPTGQQGIKVVADELYEVKILGVHGKGDLRGLLALAEQVEINGKEYSLYMLEEILDHKKMGRYF